VIRTSTLFQKKQDGEKITMLTAYDATFAHHLQLAGLDCILIGDSLGMVIQGHDSTIPVTTEQLAYHVEAVSRGVNKGPMLVADMPFMSCATEASAMSNAQQLMQAGAHMLKIEGGKELTALIKNLVQQGIPVCGHLGLRPQFVNQIGGYKIQGRNEDDAAVLRAQASALIEAGISLLVLECVPESLATALAIELPIPIIGIGAGSGVDGQVLVLHDLIGLSANPPKFSHNFLAEAKDIPGALKAFVCAVKTGDFPTSEHSF